VDLTVPGRGGLLARQFLKDGFENPGMAGDADGTGLNEGVDLAKHLGGNAEDYGDCTFVWLGLLTGWTGTSTIDQLEGVGERGRGMRFGFTGNGHGGLVCGLSRGGEFGRRYLGDIKDMSVEYQHFLARLWILRFEFRDGQSLSSGIGESLTGAEWGVDEGDTTLKAREPKTVETDGVAK